MSSYDTRYKLVEVAARMLEARPTEEHEAFIKEFSEAAYPAREDARKRFVEQLGYHMKLGG